MPDQKIANPGSKLGEAIGTAFEAAAHRVVDRIARKHGCLLRTTGETKKGKPTQLRVKDRAGNVYRIDGIIVNKANQPLILIEVKYIRYTKHNKDKGSWICNTHKSLRETYPTVRKSMALLAGQWSAPSKLMMQNFGVDLYEVPWQFLVDLLAEFDIDLGWEENDKEAVMTACLQWLKLTAAQIADIGDRMVETIRKQLETEIETALKGVFEPKISDIEVHVKTDRFTTFVYNFENREAASKFLTAYDDKELVDFDNAPKLWITDEAENELFPEIFDED